MAGNTFKVGSLAHVETVRNGNELTLVFTRIVAHPIEKVWDALTDPDKLNQWAPYTPDRNLANEGPALLKGGDDNLPDHTTQVVRADAPNRLEYHWMESRLVWELQPEGSSTKLTLRQTFVNPPDAPKFAAGWHICLAVMDHLLEGKPVGKIIGVDTRQHGWERLHDEYATLMGIEGEGWPL